MIAHHAANAASVSGWFLLGLAGAAAVLFVFDFIRHRSDYEREPRAR